MRVVSIVSGGLLMKIIRFLASTRSDNSPFGRLKSSSCPWIWVEGMIFQPNITIFSFFGIISIVMAACCGLLGWYGRLVVAVFISDRVLMTELSLYNSTRPGDRPAARLSQVIMSFSAPESRVWVPFLNINMLYFDTFQYIWRSN